MVASEETRALSRLRREELFERLSLERMRSLVLTSEGRNFLTHRFQELMAEETVAIEEKVRKDVLDLTSRFPIYQ